MSVLMANSRRDVDTNRYPAPLYIFLPVLALVLQALLPRITGRFSFFDLPLVVTIFFALGRRSPIQGMLMGSCLGLFEDALTQHPLGINGIAKTVAGYLAASVGVRIDVQNWLVRVLLNFVLTILCAAIYVFVYRGMLGLELRWNWVNTILEAVGNSLIAMVLFPLLDRFKGRY